MKRHIITFKEENGRFKKIAYLEFEIRSKEENEHLIDDLCYIAKKE